MPLYTPSKVHKFCRALFACALIFAIPHRAPAQTSSGAPNYRDPQGRFTLRIPQGWNTVQINNDAVQFSSGAAYVTLLSLPGTDPALTIGAVGTATGKQWKNFAEMRRGAVNFGERTGQYVTYSGINPTGSDSYIQLLDVTDGSLNYLLMTSAPRADFTRLKSAFDQIEQSFRLTASAKVPDAGPQAPAGAIETSTTAPARAPSPPVLQPAPQPHASTVSPDGASVYWMKLVRIVDERGFERPMTALTLLIPADWQFQGSVQYGQGTGCHANLVKLTFRASSPDGRLAFELYPGNTWQWTDDLNMRNMMQASNQQQAGFGVHGCDIMAPMTADAFLRREVLPAVRRDARVTASEPMPDAEQRLREEASQMQQTAARRGMRVNIRTDVSRVRISDVLNGAPVEEWFTAMTSSAGMAGPSFNVRMGRMGQALYYTNSADHVFAMRAPQGQLDSQEKFFQLLMGTVQCRPAMAGARRAGDRQLTRPGHQRRQRPFRHRPEGRSGSGQNDPRLVSKCHEQPGAFDGNLEPVHARRADFPQSRHRRHGGTK